MTAKTSFFAFAALIAGGLQARENYTRAFDKTVTLPAGGQVMIEHKLGNISVHTHPGAEASIHAEIHVSADNTAEAKSFADRIEIVVEPGSSTLSIRTHYPENGDHFFGMRNLSYSVHYDLVIPESAPLDIRNSFGSVSVWDVKAGSRIVNSHGDLEFRNGRGTQHLENSFAAIRVEGNAGDIEVTGGNGSLEVADIAGSASLHDRFASVTANRVRRDLTITNSNGTVEVSDSGVTTVRNSFGNVSVQNVRGDLTVNNSNGKIEAREVRGAATLNTTFGEVSFSRIGGNLSVQANNSKIEGNSVAGSATLRNSFGSVEVRDVQQGVSIQSNNSGLEVSNVHGDAALKTSFGMIHASNIGGLVRAENSNGGVTVARARGAHVTTSFAAVVLDNISGPLEIENQNGMIDAGSTAQGACQPIVLRTSFSNLRVHLAGTPNYHVSARTSFGNIRSEYPLTVAGSMSKDSLDGTLGTGACELSLNNKNGSIEILRGGS